MATLDRPVTVPFAKGTKFELAVGKEGYMRWVAHVEANDGKFQMNENRDRERCFAKGQMRDRDGVRG